jgi:hypothetical protein
MTHEKVKAAKAEAQRFLKAVAAYEKRGDFAWQNKESGAVRRASMDLTRSLAEMRKPL